MNEIGLWIIDSALSMNLFAFVDNRFMQYYSESVTKKRQLIHAVN